MDRGSAELRRRMEATLDRYHGLGQEPLVEPLATFTVDHDRADVWDANQIRSPRASTPDEIDQLLERVEEIYAGHGHRRLMCDLDTPDLLEARLVLDGWTLDLTLQHLLVDDLPGSTRAAGPAIDPVRSDGDWDELRRVTRLDHLEEATKAGREPWPEELTTRVVGHKRRKAPEMQPWLASIDGEVVGMFSSMPGVDGIGLVEDLFVAPPARGRGVAQALITHATADARSRGAGPVIIGSLPDDWPRLLYARMGFRPTFLELGWDLEVAPPDTVPPA
ncbi:MAG: GNAT family N-acetyltransferase [Acidimicrobiales bacterium]